MPSCCSGYQYEKLNVQFVKRFFSSVVHKLMYIYVSAYIQQMKKIVLRNAHSIFHIEILSNNWVLENRIIRVEVVR